ncbi:uncharacterized protein [Apostichopus japonicus]|uniref:uncharacterized protein n=1 Tax=Stichopus japonicus TaxID=307972 RepID=UPI003AB844DC
MESIIKYGGSILVEVDTIDILDSDNYVEFWISSRSGAIRVGKVGSLEFMSWQGSLPEIRFAFFESGIHSASNIYYWFVFKYYYFSQAREGENMIEVRTCRGCPSLASYGGDNGPRIMSEAEGAKIWILVTDSEKQIGSFTIEVSNGGRTMHDGNAFLTYPNNIGLQAINFGIAVGQGVESHWLLYSYTD